MDSRASVSRTTWLAHNLNRSAVFTIVCHPVAHFSHHGSDRRIPFRFYYVALICYTPRLELWLQFHEQHHVWRALRDLARAVPNKGSWDRERTRGSRESYLWDHSADYRPGSTQTWRHQRLSMFLPLCLSRRVPLLCCCRSSHVEGVIVDTQRNAAARLVP